jgi:hypothetical protein
MLSRPICTSSNEESSVTYVEIKRQLDATDDFYCRSYCLLNMFRAPLCPSSGARVLYRWLLPVGFGALIFKLLVWCGAEGYVSGGHITLSSTPASDRHGVIYLFS